MYALLDFGNLRIEQRSEFSKLKIYYKEKIVDDYKSYCDKEECYASINNFFNGKVNDYAFFSCDELTSVTIPNSVTTIGEGAFYYCTDLTSVTIPNSVTSIGEGAFYYCKSLTDITIPNSVTSIGKEAFNGVLHITYNGTATGSPWGSIGY